MLPTTDLFDLSRTKHAPLFKDTKWAWEVLSRIKGYLATELKPGNKGTVIGSVTIGEDVFIGAGTKIEPGAYIKGPAWIGANCEIRAGAYIRENVIAGDGCVLGNSCEFKNCLLFDGCQVPHFNYVGDSVLGWKAHLGAGVILSNVRLDKREVTVPAEEGVIGTGLRKFGALVGDEAEVGCNAVLSPGSVIGRQSILYPGSQWRGVLPVRSIAKLQQEFRVLARRD